ncbi:MULTISPECIES: hypothetical protein [unclassified Arthrobacter]|uniref:hypothetical protein n=1 Tax=unclassified Arthrobacter TaxID=235627 RepID=UPI0003FF47B1|nr:MULTISPECIES: hypothetical protein [unclassified Arthrobacter]PVE19120.1 hypothetical protein DDA93_04700 [Arthrobacter sp. Bz4]
MSKTRAQIAKKHGPAAAGMPDAAPTAVPPRSNGNMLLIAAAATAVLLFGYYHLLALGQLGQLAEGLTMPDMMFGGYGSAHVAALQAAMDDDALGQLSYLHKTAGTLFPLIFGIAWLLLIQLNVDRRWLRWLLWAPPLLFAVVDLWENVAIDSMLAATAPDDGQVALASALTIARWVLLGLSAIAGLLAVLLPGSVRGKLPVLLTDPNGTAPESR